MSNQNTPLFSVIVPVYNVAKYLPQCIESVLNQDFRDFELILVDDGSPDNSGEICDQFQKMDARVRVIHKSNGGLISARIAGIQAAAGEYIFNVDGDDFIEPDVLHRINEVILQHAPDMISFGYQTIDENAVVSAPRFDQLAEGLYAGAELEAIFPKLLYDPQSRNFSACSSIQYSIWSKVFRKALVYPIQTGIPVGISRGEDVAAVMTAICNCSSLYVTSFVGYYYRIQSASMTHTFKPDTIPKLLLLLDYLEKNTSQIPVKNIRQFAMTEIFYHTKDAVHGFEKYADYKKYLNTEYTDKVISVIKQFDVGKLTLTKRLQILAIKKHCWWAYWLVYKYLRRFYEYMNISMNSIVLRV